MQKRQFVITIAVAIAEVIVAVVVVVFMNQRRITILGNAIRIIVDKKKHIQQILLLFLIVTKTLLTAKKIKQW